MKMNRVTLIFFVYYSTYLVMGHGSHGSKKTGGGGSLKHEDLGKLSSDIDHITEHLREQIDLNKKMSPEELEFYYFMEHDFNNDTKLDGLEILSAIKHSDLAHDLKVDTTNMSPEQAKKAYENEINNYVDIIDQIMKEDDYNKDGYLSYLEFVLARRRDARAEEASKNRN